ncbi:MAG TPA: hypothetical protein VK668_17470 [Mucilaginibacter sp.]|nr:hypothetical protein [Mucilaginibacter sp.]
MKTSIKLIALFLLLGTGAFASTPTKHNHKVNMHDQVSLIPLHQKEGFAIMVDKADPGKSVVIIYDRDLNVVFKDCLTKGNTRSEKKYIFPDLANGDYTVEVFSKNHDVKTQFFIYNDGKKRIVRLS